MDRRRGACKKDEVEMVAFMDDDSRMCKHNVTNCDCKRSDYEYTYCQCAPERVVTKTVLVPMSRRETKRLFKNIPKRRI